MSRGTARGRFMSDPSADYLTPADGAHRCRCGRIVQTDCPVCDPGSLRVILWRVVPFDRQHHPMPPLVHFQGGTSYTKLWGDREVAWGVARRHLEDHADVIEVQVSPVAPADRPLRYATPNRLYPLTGPTRWGWQLHERTRG